MADIKLTTGIQTHRFFDEDDNLIAQFRINPMDINLAVRAMEVAEWFESVKPEIEKLQVETDGDGKVDIESARKLAEFNSELEKKVAYVLGCDTKDIFECITATTPLPGNGMWVEIVLDKIITEIEPQIKERTKAMEKAQEKYLRKYEPK